MDKRWLDSSVILKNSASHLNISTLWYLSLISIHTNIDVLELIVTKNSETENKILEVIQKELDIEIIEMNQIKEYQILNYGYQDRYCKKRYLLCTNNNKEKIIILNSYDPAKIKSFFIRFPDYLIKLVRRKDFFAFIEYSFKQLNSIKARYFLDLCSSKVNAKNIYYITTITFIGCISCYLYYLSKLVFFLIANFLYFVHNLFKLILFKTTMLRLKLQQSSYYNIKYFPCYTILVPLYKEVQMLRSIVKSVEMLNYPKDKLDIKIIIEEDDLYIIKELAIMHLPNYFHIVKVPYSLPRTKPKALNYAMNYILGEYLVVYDAEDRPDPDQLLKAVYVFQKLPSHYKCLQAKINFYNKDESLLTKLMSIEYSLWFDFLLPGLDYFNLPVTLGGTSNHFKVDALKSLGCWDAYNVTEDADLGLRIYMSGFKTMMIDSYTYEEAPIDIKSWIYQRTRWTKGFIQTAFVFLNYDRNIRRRLGVCVNASINIFILFSPICFLLTPILIVNFWSNKNIVLGRIWQYNLTFVLSYMQIVSVVILYKLSRNLRNVTLQDLLCFMILPLYFMLHVVASYRAVFELCTKPFNWNKTKHGITRIK